MSNEDYIGTGVCRNADTDPDEKRAWVRGASPDERLPVKYLESKDIRLGYTVDHHRSHGHPLDRCQLLPPQQGSEYEIYALHDRSPIDSGYASLQGSRSSTGPQTSIAPCNDISADDAYSREKSDNQKQRQSQIYRLKEYLRVLRVKALGELRKDDLPPPEACSWADARVEESTTHHFGSSQRDTQLAAGTSNQQYQMSVSVEQPASDNSNPSERSFSDPPIPEHDSGFSSEASSESDSNAHTATLSPEDDVWLILAYAKHRMMLSLMGDVYAIMDSQWSVGIRTRTGSEPAKTGTNSQNSSSSTPSTNSRVSSFSTPSSALNWRKRMQDREDDEKKRKTRSPRSGIGDQRRLFACCFHKYNAPKYCSNSETGTKYRSCAGPGFSKISQLKQHLRRIHRAPIYCPRCWLVLESQAEMASHANTQKRCERKEPQVQEGVDQDKMRMITDTWGVSWGGIYEILFPGAPVPSPYYQEDDPSLESLEPSSPRSQELRDFDTYSRTTLPLLVEANLRAIVESQIAPIEERVRAMVVDIVRTCQSTVARNYQLMIAPASLANDRTQSSNQTITSAESAGQMDREPIQIFGDGTAGLDFFHEPSHGSLPGPMYNHSTAMESQNLSLDSSFSSPPFSCSCSCHGYSNTWNTANGRNSCQSCAYMHIEIDDLGSL